MRRTLLAATVLVIGFGFGMQAADVFAQGIAQDEVTKLQAIDEGGMPGCCTPAVCTPASDVPVCGNADSNADKRERFVGNIVDKLLNGFGKLAKALPFGRR